MLVFLCTSPVYCTSLVSDQRSVCSISATPLSQPLNPRISIIFTYNGAAHLVILPCYHYAQARTLRGERLVAFIAKMTRSDKT
jgi:hypothetical protein